MIFEFSCSISTLLNNQEKNGHNNHNQCCLQTVSLQGWTEDCASTIWCHLLVISASNYHSPLKSHLNLDQQAFNHVIIWFLMKIFRNEQLIGQIINCAGCQKHRTQRRKYYVGYDIIGYIIFSNEFFCLPIYSLSLKKCWWVIQMVCQNWGHLSINYLVILSPR